MNQYALTASEACMYAYKFQAFLNQKGYAVTVVIDHYQTNAGTSLMYGAADADAWSYDDPIFNIPEAPSLIYTFASTFVNSLHNTRLTFRYSSQGLILAWKKKEFPL
jgi:hypothetical protein